ncbi:MAG: V-type ATP synthase subunit F [Clostridia bacterium]|nr:V-type ATP synthase subunit F [Clostridia bacterium]
MRSGIAVVGDKDSVLAFKAIGLEVFPVSNESEARDTVKQLARSYEVIFITDKLAKKIDNLLVRYKARPYPVVVPIPSAEGSNGFGIDGIREDVEKAIGVDILFSREDK